MPTPSSTSSSRRPARRAVFIASVALACCLGSIRAPAQNLDDFRTFEHASSGVRFKYPQDFKPVPTQPTEKLIIARFAREEPYLARKIEKNRRPESIMVFVLKAAGTGVSAPKEGPKTQEEAIERSNSLTSYKEFFESRFPGSTLAAIEPDAKKAADKPYKEFKITGNRRGYLYVRDVGSHTYGVVGFADDEVYDAMSRRFRAVGQTMQKMDGDQTKDRSLEYYEGKTFRDPGFRAKARREMLKQWEARDTENFFVLYHTDNMKMVNKIANDLEAIRPLYMKYFPAVKPIEAVSVVRICKDLDEYRRYGGPPTSGGYWNYVAKELVFFDYSNLPKSADTNSRHMDERDAYIVLYHEAFHQYIYYAAGEISPHSWFNEGLGDTFSGTIIYDDTLKVKEIGLDRWRIDVVKEANESDKWIPLQTLLHAEQPEYYERSKVRVMYAEGWALCYFLMIAKDGGQKNEAWSKIIPNYYEALKAARQKNVGLLSASAGVGDRMVAEKNARDEALTKTFACIDVNALETAWRAWIKKTKDPWAASRK